MRGSARLSAYGRRVFQHGFHGAHADELAAAEAAGLGRGRTAAAGRRPLTPEPGAGATEAGPASPARCGSPSGWSPPLLVVIGSRGVLTGRLPAVGQFTPFPSLVVDLLPVLRRLAPVGRGTTAPAAPGPGDRRRGRHGPARAPWG